MADKKTVIPAVPIAGLSLEMRTFLNALRTYVANGAIVDKPTTADIVDALTKLKNMPRGSTRLNSQVHDLFGKLVQDATQPSGFGVTSSARHTLLSWDIPTYDGHAFTEVYRQTVALQSDGSQPVSEFSLAQKVGVSSGPVYSDTVDYNTGYYYWIRHVNQKNEPGPLSSTVGTYIQIGGSLKDEFTRSGLHYIQEVDVLPESNIGNVIYNKTDNRLYTWNGNKYVYFIGANGRINPLSIPDGSITASKISANAIGAQHIIGQSIKAEHLATGSVTSGKIGANAVTAYNIAANSINGNHIVASSSFTSPIIKGGTISGTVIEGAIIRGARLIGATGDFSGTVIVESNVGEPIRTIPVDVNVVLTSNTAERHYSKMDGWCAWASSGRPPRQWRTFTVQSYTFSGSKTVEFTTGDDPEMLDPDLYVKSVTPPAKKDISGRFYALNPKTRYSLEVVIEHSDTFRYGEGNTCAAEREETHYYTERAQPKDVSHLKPEGHVIIKTYRRS